MKFYLGAAKVSWLTEAGVPLFYPYPELRSRRELPRAIAPWALDSGGYTELKKYGKWTITPKDYAAGVRRLRDGIGQMDFACPQDWMCAPPILEATGLSVVEHQRRTLWNYLHLLAIAPDVPWAPVLQGWEVYDYHAHAKMYEEAGIDLTQQPIVAVGSIAARQEDPKVGALLRQLKYRGLATHALGVKNTGVSMYGDALASADSMAWSFTARFMFEPALPECVGKHAQCTTCLPWALEWRRRLMESVDEIVERHTQQPALFTPDDSYEQDALWTERNLRGGVREHAA